MPGSNDQLSKYNKVGGAMGFDTPFLPIHNHPPTWNQTPEHSQSPSPPDRGACVVGCGDETEMARVVCGLWDQAFTGTVHSPTRLNSLIDRSCYNVYYSLGVF